ncbi:hypothetical protein [Pseudomonas frederiksbergensis]|uniref:Uncharacterized protein n=1 Tax=Pseudomonas frederiksbergensis TaxID=104087 RepID=A0A6L5BXB9_9PSED|nr:hypothetical protein FX983_00632 [Pseudomonas frederiksbergensis]
MCAQTTRLSDHQLKAVKPKEVDWEVTASRRMISACSNRAALMPQTATHQQLPAGVRALDLGQHTFQRDIGLIHRSRHSLNEPVRFAAPGQVAETQ